MVGLTRMGDSPQSVTTAMQWANLNYARHAIVLIAWLAALKTFSLVYERRGNRKDSSSRPDSPAR
jgi:hypothetical protein